MKSLTQKLQKSFAAMLATACGAGSFILLAGLPSPAAAAQNTVFSCSAEGVIVEVKRLNNGTLRYEAYNIPTNLRRPDLVLQGATVRRDNYGNTYYTFRNNNYRYVAVKDSGYGRVLVYKNNKLLATKYCGDV